MATDRTPGDRPDQPNELNDFLDAFGADETRSDRDLDPATAEAVRHFIANDDTPAPPSDLAAQIWENLMNQSVIAGTIPLPRSTVALPASNGRVRTLPWGQERTRERPWQRGGRWVVTQMATAALLLITLGLGYVAFGPGRAGPDQPMSTPALGAQPVTPATSEVSPTVPEISREGHLITGTWRWQEFGDEKIAVFDVDGTYLEYSHELGVGIGGWRPTGPVTAELVVVYQTLAASPARDEVFAPDFAPAETDFAPGTLTRRLTVQYDPTARAITVTGTSEVHNPDGTTAAPTAIEPRTGRRLAGIDMAVGGEAATGGDTQGIVVVSVVAADGTPISGICLTLAGPTSIAVCDDADGDADPTPGLIEVDSILVGDYTVDVRPPAGFVASAPVTVSISAMNMATVTVVLATVDGQPTPTPNVASAPAGSEATPTPAG